MPALPAPPAPPARALTIGAPGPEPAGAPEGVVSIPVMSAPKRNLPGSDLAGDCAAAGRMHTGKRAIAANADAIQAALPTLDSALRDGSLNMVSSSNQYRKRLNGRECAFRASTGAEGSWDRVANSPDPLVCRSRRLACFPPVQ